MKYQKDNVSTPLPIYTGGGQYKVQSTPNGGVSPNRAMRRRRGLNIPSLAGHPVKRSGYSIQSEGSPACRPGSVAPTMIERHQTSTESVTNSLVNHSTPRSAFYKCAYAPRRGFTLRSPPVDGLTAGRREGTEGYRRVERGGRGVVGGSVRELVDPHPRTPRTRALVQSVTGSLGAVTGCLQKVGVSDLHAAVHAHRQNSQNPTKPHRRGGIEGWERSTPPFDAHRVQPDEDRERGEPE